MGGVRVQEAGEGAGQPLGGVAGTHGSTLVLRYAPLRPINIITALKPLQFVSDLHRRSRRPSWPRRATPPTLCRGPASFCAHTPAWGFVIAVETELLLQQRRDLGYKMFITGLLRLFRGTVCER